MAIGSRGGGAARGGGARTGGVRRVFEEFKPVSEWQQDDESLVLNIYLPGFMKEQIKVSTEGRNIIRVRGERLVAGNKWSRFQEDFQVPEDGEMNSVRAKYQGGILNISVPKKKVEKPQEAPPTSKIQKQPTPPKGQHIALEPQKASDEQKQPTPQKSKEKAFSAVDTSQSTAEKSIEPQKASDDPKKEHHQDGDQRDKRSTSPLHTIEAQKASVDPRKEQHHNGDERDQRSITPLSTVISPKKKKQSEPKGKGIASGAIELPEVETAKMTKLENSDIPEKKADNNELYGALLTTEKYKKAVKGLSELNEERQLLVNMGVAMLVIVGLTAYVTYKFASGNKN